MASVNKVILLGLLAKSPKLIELPEGNKIFSLLIMVDNACEQDQDCCIHDIQYFQVYITKKIPDYKEASLQKIVVGSEIYVEGKLKKYIWQSNISKHHTYTEQIIESTKIQILSRANSKFTPLSEKDIIKYEDWNWWKNLSYQWKAIFLTTVLKCEFIDYETEYQEDGLVYVVSNPGFNWEIKRQIYPYLKELLNTTAIDLTEVGISTISPLLHLGNLESLILAHNAIENINEISTLKNLKLLDLSNSYHSGYYYNAIHDLSPLAKLEKLESLYISRLEINDTTFFNSLINLKNLFLSIENKISDFSFLLNLKKLKKLIYETSMPFEYLTADDGSHENLFEVLSQLINIEELHLRNNEIAKIDFLENLTQLKNLDLSVNFLSDIYPLKNLKNLEKLDLSSNRIINITPLKFLKNLTKLKLSFNSVKYISVFRFIPQLQILEMSNTRFENISPMQYLSALEKLNASFSNLYDITAFLNLKSLRIMLLNNNKIHDIFSLKNLTNLTVLDLSHNQITDITPLSNLINLQILKLDFNNISDITPLANLKKLEVLSIGLGNLDNRKITGNPVYEHQINWLREKLPNCKINDYPYCSEVIFKYQTNYFWTC